MYTHTFTRQVRQGFTLIELLVVITIIGILSSVVLASLNDTRAAARDAQRVSDMQQIRNAFELYYIANGEYPCEVASRCNNQTINANGRIGEGAGLDTLLAEYMDVPHDPLGPGNDEYYYYYDGQHCNDSGTLDNNVVATISFNAAETRSDIRRDTTCGSEGDQDTADYVMIVGLSDG